MYLTLNKWLELFNTNKISYSTFLKKIKVKKNNNDIINLKDYKKLSNKIMKLFYEIIVLNKKKYLTNFYNKSLKVNDTDKYPLCLSNNKNIQYKNIVRNLYYKEILQETDTIQPNLKSFLNVIIDMYKNYTLDYKLVTPSVIKLIEKNALSNVLSGLYFRSSIMNPVVPYSLTTHIDYKFKVLTPTLGWSSYFIGMMKNKNLEEYVGIDVINKVCNNTKKLATKNKIKNDIYCKPSEDLYKDKIFMKKYKNYFDFIFFSPPYFQLELYKGKNQSTNRYKDYDTWLEKYWRDTVKLCYHTIKKDKLLIYIISGYNDKKNYINLEKDMNNILIEEGFKYIKTLRMTGSNVGFTSHRKSDEKIFIFSSGKTIDVKYFNKLVKCNRTKKKK
jgi:hypothetical protein